MAKRANGVPASAKAGDAAVPSGKELAGSSTSTAVSPPRGPRRRVAPATQAVARQTQAAPPAPARSRGAGNGMPKPPRPPRKAKAPDAEPAPTAPALSEEEQIGSAKYLPRELPPRVFEEERFIFPESYGVNRVRLLVKDPYWLFAHWDVDPRVREGLRREKGERVAALARLTLRLTDNAGAGGLIVLPEGARSWYVRAVPGHRAYRVELGLTLPSGEYRPLARSNAVSTPRIGPSPEKATRRATYHRAAAAPPGEAPGGPGDARGASARGARRKAALAGGPGSAEAAAAPESSAGPHPSEEPGGASDVHRPGGASDLFRR